MNAAVSTLRVDVSDGVASVVLARPDRLNALSRAMMCDLLDVVDEFRASPEIRVLLLTGEGRMFSAGADVREIGDRTPGEDTEAVVADARLGDRLCTALESPDLVTIAAVHGRAVGGAAAIVAACDLRYFADDAYLVVPELAMGLPLAWGGVERLARDIGPAVLRELLLTGRPLGAAEAVARGFATASVPADRLVEHALSQAGVIASRPTIGVEATLRRVLAIADRRDATGMDDDAVTLAEAAAEPEVVAAMRSYLTALAERSGARR